MDNDMEDMFSLFVSGDQGAFSYYYKSLFNDLYAYGTCLCADKEMLEDTIQDIFYSIYFNRSRFSDAAHLKFYLIKSLRHAIHNHHKKSHKEDPSTDLRFFVSTTVLDTIIDEEERDSLQTRVNDLLSVLTDRQREVITLRYMESLDYEQISEILDMTVHGARKLVSRAIQRLRDTNRVEALLLISSAFSFLLEKTDFPS